VLVAPSLFLFPGSHDVSDETWKLILLLGIGFVVVYAFRHAFHWFFYKWRFGERIVVLGSSTEAQLLATHGARQPDGGLRAARHHRRARPTTD
jgi:hypothetical protein